MIAGALSKLSSLRQAVASLEGFRFYSCSLLLIYEGDIPGVESGSTSVQNCGNSFCYGLKNPKYSSKSHTDSLSSCFSGCSRPKEFLREKPLPPVSRQSKKIKPNIASVVTEAGNVNGVRSSPAATEDDVEASEFTECSMPTTDLHFKSKLETKQQTAVFPVDIRLIDFAHFCYQDPVVHPGPDGGFLYGLDKIITLLQTMVSK